MYEYLKGELVEITEHFVVIDVKGIGYKVFIPLHLYGTLSLGKEILFFTHFVVKEEEHQLYGFLNKTERTLFEKLIEISGIGPKTALNIIGHLPLPLFQQAVHANHVKTFTQIPGIGKKTAERLLLELRDKQFLQKEFSAQEKHSLGSTKLVDALSALTNLGFSHVVAREAIDKAVKELPKDSDLETLITYILKNK